VLTAVALTAVLTTACGAASLRTAMLTQLMAMVAESPEPMATMAMEATALELACTDGEPMAKLSQHTR